MEEKGWIELEILEANKEKTNPTIPLKKPTNLNDDIYEIKETNNSGKKEIQFKRVVPFKSEKKTYYKKI